MSLRFPGFAAESESPGVPGLQNLIAHLRPHRLAPAPDRQGQHPDQILRRGLFPQHALKELLQLRPVSAVPDVLRRPGEGLCQGVLFLFTVSLRLRIQRLHGEGARHTGDGSLDQAAQVVIAVPAQFPTDFFHCPQDIFIHPKPSPLLFNSYIAYQKSQVFEIDSTHSDSFRQITAPRT